MITYFKRILAELPRRRRPPVRIPVARPRVSSSTQLGTGLRIYTILDEMVRKANERLLGFVNLFRGR